jgi:UDP-N-acetyl-D-glucosamine dehydrogenase
MTNMSNQFIGTVVVVGQGYVGLPLSMALTKARWSVIGLDSDLAKINLLKSGTSSIEDVEDSTLKEVLSSGSYIPSSNTQYVSQADVIVICVPTPLDEQGNPDLSLLINAIQSIGPYIKNNTLIISESTSYPGTLRKIVVDEVYKSCLIESPELYFAVSPERVNPGDKLWSQKNTPRLVGGIDPIALKKAVSFYETFCDEVVCLESPEIAEAAKLLENTFRLINISAINEFAQVCQSAGIQVSKVIDAAATKPYGFLPFRPGAGIGGHCIPVDPVYLEKWAGSYKVNFSLLTQALEVNRNRSKYIVSRVMRIKNNDKNNIILVLGVGYKSGLSDTRESPAGPIVNELKLAGFDYEWFDPLVESWEGKKCKDINSDYSAAILVVNQPGIDLSALIKNKVPVLDCTYTFTNLMGVISL